MEYKGKLFGKVGKTYFPLELTTTDVEKLQEESAQWNLYAKSVDEQIVDRNSLIDKLQAENQRLKEALKEIGNTFKPLELSLWDFVDELRDKAKQALKGEVEEQEPPTWEARDAWDGGFADNH
jgi:chromosome segregation ATPase